MRINRNPLRCALNRCACFPVRSAAAELRAAPSMAMPGEYSGRDRCPKADPAKSEMIPGAWRKSLIRNGCGVAVGVGTERAGPTPHPKHSHGEGAGVAGGGSKNGKGVRGEPRGGPASLALNFRRWPGCAALSAVTGCGGVR